MTELLGIEAYLSIRVCSRFEAHLFFGGRSFYVAAYSQSKPKQEKQPKTNATTPPISLVILLQQEKNKPNNFPTLYQLLQSSAHSIDEWQKKRKRLSAYLWWSSNSFFTQFNS